MLLCMTYSGPAKIWTLNDVDDCNEAAPRDDLSMHITYLYSSSLWYLQYPSKILLSPTYKVSDVICQACHLKSNKIVSTMLEIQIELGNRYQLPSVPRLTACAC